MAARTVTVRGREAVPIDAVADRVTRPGFEWRPDLNYDRVWWDAPPPPEPIPAGLIDLAGERLGRLSVVGFGHTREIAGRRNGRGFYWIVRCDCGRYELRTHQVWMRWKRRQRRQKSGAERSRNTLAEMCQRCRHLIVVQQRIKRREAGVRGHQRGSQL